MFHWFNEPKVPFIRFRRFFLGLSLVVVLAGIYATFLLWKGQANLGTDFGGGVLLHLSARKDLPVDRIREVLKSEALGESQIQQVREKGVEGFRLMVRIKREITGEVGKTGDTVLSLLTRAFPEAGFVLDGSDEVGPAVSLKLRNDAIQAFLISMICIMVYIAFRFDFRFGVISVIATIHDIFVMVGFIVLPGFEFNLLMVTAILTISGYSLNDTVVIFDRIRENLKHLADTDYPTLVNRSLNETLNRTINTGGTTIIALVPLYFFGGEVLRDFALVLIFGIFLGTYSSVFIAAPLAVEWHLMTVGPSKKG
jgi:preprotein translocase SecF subunit